MGHPTQDPATDLLGYKIQGKHAPRKKVKVANELTPFPFSYDTRRTDSLLVPSGAAPGALPADTSRVDHYRCLRERLTPGSASFPDGVRLQVTDRFATRTLTVKKPSKLCVPTTEDGNPVKNPDVQLVCYRVKPSRATKASDVAVDDEFGQAMLALQREVELCLPSTMQP